MINFETVDLRTLQDIIDAGHPLPPGAYKFEGQLGLPAEQDTPES